MSGMRKKLPASYFQTTDTLTLAKNLLGKFLVSSIDNVITSGMIIETEGYLGAIDRASHAFQDRKSNRTAPLYLPGGHWYVYLCYGLHHLINVVAHQKDIPEAVLIRALKPVDGINEMVKRRKIETISRLTSGPGSLCQALGINRKLSGETIGETVWIEDRGVIIPDNQIITSPRIGVAYAKEDALLPYRFRLKN